MSTVKQLVSFLVFILLLCVFICASGVYYLLWMSWIFLCYLIADPFFLNAVPSGFSFLWEEILWSSQWRERGGHRQWVYCNISSPQQVLYSAPINHSKTHTYFAPSEHPTFTNHHHITLYLTYPLPFALTAFMAHSPQCSWTTMLLLSVPHLFSDPTTGTMHGLHFRVYKQSDYNVDGSVKLFHSLFDFTSSLFLKPALCCYMGAQCRAVGVLQMVWNTTHTFTGLQMWFCYIFDQKQPDMDQFMAICAALTVWQSSMRPSSTV